MWFLLVYNSLAHDEFNGVQAVINRKKRVYNPASVLLTEYQQSVKAFWRTLHRDGKISPAGRGGGVNAHPLSLYLPSRTNYKVSLIQYVYPVYIYISIVR